MSVHLSSFVTYTFSKFPYEKFTLKVEHKWKGILETRAVAKLDLVYIWIFLHRLQPRTQSVRFSETALRAVLSFGIHVWILLPLSLSPAPSLSLSLFSFTFFDFFSGFHFLFFSGIGWEKNAGNWKVWSFLGKDIF